MSTSSSPTTSMSEQQVGRAKSSYVRSGDTNFFHARVVHDACDMTPPALSPTSIVDDFNTVMAQCCLPIDEGEKTTLIAEDVDKGSYTAFVFSQSQEEMNRSRLNGFECVTNMVETIQDASDAITGSTIPRHMRFHVTPVCVMEVSTDVVPSDTDMHALCTAVLRRTPVADCTTHRVRVSVRCVDTRGTLSVIIRVSWRAAMPRNPLQKDRVTANLSSTTATAPSTSPTTSRRATVSGDELILRLRVSDIEENNWRRGQAVAVFVFFLCMLSVAASSLTTEFGRLILLFYFVVCAVVSAVLYDGFKPVVDINNECSDFLRSRRRGPIHKG